MIGRIGDIGFDACLLLDLKALTAVQDIARSACSTAPELRALAATSASCG